MNQSVTLKSLGGSCPLPRKSRFNPRLEILDEVVAGFLWMQLDLPEDISRSELEGFAHRLVGRIQAGDGEAAIAGEIAGLQLSQLCRPANPFVTYQLARRAIAAVTGAYHDH
jgi:hypothetical protein